MFIGSNLLPTCFSGELDPHGPSGDGNPVGGNVTSNAVTGDDVNYEEWMVSTPTLTTCNAAHRFS